MNRREFAISLGTIAAVIAGGASEASESASGATTLKPKVVGGDKCQSAGKFAVGQSVQIRNDIQPIGHYRMPIYVRGKIGTIERILPCFINPEEEGYGKNAGTMDRLYRVRISQTKLWKDYNGSPSDVLEIEVFESWIKSVTANSTN